MESSTSNREKHIEFTMNYCQHYTHGKGVDMICAAGMNIKEIQKVQTGEKGIKWGPCIGGHTLPNPTEYCPHWVRKTREMGEKRADDIEEMLERMAIVMPVVSKWRTKPKPKQDRFEVIECPKCKGKLHLSQSSYNGHVHGSCETSGCVSWME